MKTALVHDWLVTPGGSESVLEAIYALYPSPIHTLVKNDHYLKETSLARAEIITSFVARLPWSGTRFRAYLPLFPLAMEQFDFSPYDLVISSSHAVAKGVLTNEHQLHICYCHTPMRYAWGLYHEYMREMGSTIPRMLLGWAAHRLRMWDATTTPRVDHFIANSLHIQKKIQKIYGRTADVIYPPVKTSHFALETHKDSYYLTASRLVGYKKVDLVVQAFAAMPEKKLLVIGDGPEMQRIKKYARSNIEILGYQGDENLKTYLQKARALVFAAEEDFGILPVEAQACGTPVIAYGRGGALETVREGITGLFFQEQTVASIIQAVDRFERMEDTLDPHQIRAHAEQFDTLRFNKAFTRLVQEKMQIFQEKR